ncbi:MAG: TSUP family transporter [Spirochaetales bacterium]|nr:TSUP family transporter [Spirochaetales bacterium]
MELDIIVILILTVITFFAGFIDSIAGGGGLIIIPSFLIAGIPPQFALGTNKFQATLGTSVSTINFIHKKKVSLKIVLSGIFFALSGAYIGSRLILSFNSDIAGKIIVFMLPLGVLATLIPRKKVKRSQEFHKLDYFVKIPLICLIIGFYDGFFGPGTGSFLTLFFYLFMKLNLIEATANAKVFNFVSNLGALVAFLFSGKVLFLLALPMALSNMAGNYFGSHLALKKGDKVIKLFLIIVLVILFVTLIWKYFLS